MDKEKSVIDIIFAEYNKFFDAEKKIADYIMNNGSKVIEMKISELAESAGTSEATISRFCKKCNMKGFHHLKITLAKDLVESKKEEITTCGDINTNNLRESLNNILANKIEELKQTVSMMDEKSLREILDKLKNARNVQFAAVGNTIPVALDGCYKFNQIGIPSVANTIWETQIAYTYNLNKEDVVIAFSFPRYSKKSYQVVDYAKSKGAHVISITDSYFAPVACLSDNTLLVKSNMASFVDSLVPAMTVANALAISVGMKEKSEITKYFNDLEKIWKDYAIYE